MTSSRSLALLLVILAAVPGLAVTDTTPAANFTIHGTAGVDTVTISDGPGGTTTISSPTFESVTFANKTNVVFDGLGGLDRLTFNNPNPATGLVSFIVKNGGFVNQSAAVRYPSLGIDAIEINLPLAANDADRIEMTTRGLLGYVDADDIIVGDVSNEFSGLHSLEEGVNMRSINGSITLSDRDAAAVIHAPWSASLTSGMDITIDVDRQAVVAGGNITIVAGRDAVLGDPGSTRANDLRAGGHVYFKARRNVALGGFTTVVGHRFGANGFPVVYVDAGEKILQVDRARFRADGVPNAEVVFISPSISLMGEATGVESPLGVVAIETASLEIGSSSGIAARDSISVYTSGIDLGPVMDVPGSPIELSDAELDRIFAPSVHLTGPIEVSEPISFTTGESLHLYEGVTGSGVGNLRAANLHIASPWAPPQPLHWAVTPTSVQLGAGASVRFNGVAVLALRGSAAAGGGGDTFGVEPSATTKIVVNARYPFPHMPSGDSLTFDLTDVENPVLTAAMESDGSVETGYSGRLTSNNRQPVEFSSIESFANAPVDLRVTNTDGKASVAAGEALQYLITVTNAASIPVEKAKVVDIVPPELLDVRWTCGASTGSNCSPFGRGDIRDVVNLAARGTLTYIVTGTTNASRSGTLTNTVTVTTPDECLETDPANNTATDRTSVVIESRRSRPMRRR